MRQTRACVDLLRRGLGVALAATMMLATASAQEFRSVRPIRRSSGQGAVTSTVDSQVVLRALERIVAAWNTPGLRAQLGARFYDADRLVDTLTSVPRDARLRLLAIEAVHVLRQELRPGPEGSAALRRTSVLAVVARTQVEFEDAATGFVRIEGTNEYVFEVTEAVDR